MAVYHAVVDDSGLRIGLVYGGIGAERVQETRRRVAKRKWGYNFEQSIDRIESVVDGIGSLIYWNIGRVVRVSDEDLLQYMG